MMSLRVVAMLQDYLQRLKTTFFEKSYSIGLFDATLLDFFSKNIDFSLAMRKTVSILQIALFFRI